MKRLYLLTLVFIGLIIAETLNARIINVPTEFQTIQAGVDSSTHGDTVLVQPGIYTGHVNFNGHSITLGSAYLTTGDTAYISSTVILNNLNGPVVGIFNHEDSTTALVGFTIKHDGVIGTLRSGIVCQGVSPMISNNIIKENYNGTGSGGGIYCYHANPIIENNKIINNRAPNTKFGGGIYCERSNPIIRNNIIRGNISGW
jgi:hypothetical protein